MKQGEYLYLRPAVIRKHLHYGEMKGCELCFTRCCSREEAALNSQVSKGTCEFNDDLIDFSKKEDRLNSIFFTSRPNNMHCSAYDSRH